MNTKGGKVFKIIGSEWDSGWLIVNFQIGGDFGHKRFLYYSKKEAYALLRDKARKGLLD
jgi:hypothetical protein